MSKIKELKYWAFYTRGISYIVEFKGWFGSLFRVAKLSADIVLVA